MAEFKELIASLCPLILLAVFIHKWRRSGGASARRKMLPPSPRKLPIIGNLHQLGELPHRTLHSLSKRYGGMMLLHFGNVPVLIASSADAAAEIMKSQDTIFSNRPKLRILDRLTYGSMDVAFAQIGDYWRRVRGMCVLNLLSTKKVQSYRIVREEETSLMMREIRKLQSSSGVVKLSQLIITMTNDVLCRVALGRKYGGDEEGRNFPKLVDELSMLIGTHSVGDYVPWLGWVNKFNGLDARVADVAKRFDEFLGRVIQQHRDRERTRGSNDDDDGIHKDFVDVLLRIQKESEDTSPVQDYTIKALTLDMFIAGTSVETDIVDM